MKKRFLASLLLLALLMSCISLAAAADPDVEDVEPLSKTDGAEDVSGEGDAAACGDGLSWSVSGTMLTVTGDGEMFDFDKGKAPWQDFKNTITAVVLSGKITKVGSYAFEDFDKIEGVEFGSALTHLGKRAFAGCDGLTKLYLPKTFRTFEEECLYGCSNLKEIHSEGPFPHFRQNCLWNTTCKIYFPASAPWSVIYIEQLEENFQGRIEFLASDGTDPYTPTEPKPTEEIPTRATEAPTVPATEATVATTLPATQPTTEETTEPATEATGYTRDPNRETLSFTATTQAPTEPAPRQSGGGIGFVLVGLVLAILGTGALIFRATNRRR